MGHRAAWTVNYHNKLLTSALSSLLFLTTICLIVAWATGNPALAVPHYPGNVTSELMTLDEARRHMVELINRDRATCGLPPVRLDPVASRAAQQHSDEMAQYGYISHWDLQGRKPDQRYNEFGGRGAVFENVFTNHDQPYANYRAPLAARQLFSRRDIEQAEGWFFNQTPPNDRHRRNILDPNHKLVGLGISLSVHRSLGDRVTVSEEFVHSPGDLSAWSTDLIPGQVQKLTGKLSPEVSLAGLQLCREPLPRPMTTAQLKTTGEYNLPGQTVSCYTPDSGGVGPLAVRKAPDGEEFSFALNTDKGWQDGLYYLVVWVRDSINATPYIGSTRTVRVSSTPAPPPATPPVIRESDVQIATGTSAAQSARLAAARYPHYPLSPSVSRLSGSPGYYQGPRPSTTAYSQPSPLRFPVPAAISNYAAYAPLSTAPVVPARQYGLYAQPGGYGSQPGARRSGQIVPQYGPAPLMRNPNYVPPGAQGPTPARLERSATFIESAPTAVVPEHQTPKPATPAAVQSSLAAKPAPAPVVNKSGPSPKPAAAANQKSAGKPAVWNTDPKQSLCPMEASD